MKNKFIHSLTALVIVSALVAPVLAQAGSSTPCPVNVDQTVEKAPCGCPVKKHHKWNNNKVYKHHVKWHMRKSSCPNKDCLNKQAPKQPCPCQQ